jgi:transposase InsO family protein
VKYACIARHVGEREVRLVCDVLEVSPSGYYASRQRSPCARAIADERLLLTVRIAHEKSGETYGTPRVQRELTDEGIHVGTKRVARLMRDDGLVGRAPRRRQPVTTDSVHDHPIARNLLDREFDVNGRTVRIRTADGKRQCWAMCKTCRYADGSKLTVVNGEQKSHGLP